MATTLSTITDRANGASFRLADLHVHSFGGSVDVTDSTMTPEAVVDEAVRQGISVLAITDHCSMVNTQRSLVQAQQYIGQLVVFAGVEVTTAHGHLLVYFAPDRTHDLATFIGKINIIYPASPDAHTAMSMSDVATEAQRLGGVCVAAHVDKKTGFEAMQAGYPNWKKDIVCHSGIQGVEVANPLNIRWFSSEDVGSPEAVERVKLLKRRSDATPARLQLARLQNSDAHTLAGFVNSRSRRELTRIKMDELTFGSFRTALADPEARIRVEVELPRSIPIIVGASIDGGFLGGQVYHLSPNLTCFIGGRGTGKSTSLRCIAHGLGLDAGLAEYDNCPDSVVVYCRDAQGITYRYERMRGSDEPTVKAQEGTKILDASPDAFRVEYYGQGDLARVAADPLKNPELLQEFLDRHTDLSDLQAREQEVLSSLSQNGSVLRPLESDEAGRSTKEAAVGACDLKLKAAEAGKLKDVAAQQAALGAERSFATTLQNTSDTYKSGISLRNFIKNFAGTHSAAGAMTADHEANAIIGRLRALFDGADSFLKNKEAEINTKLKATFDDIGVELASLRLAHSRLEVDVAAKVEVLKQGGLTGSLADLKKVVDQRGVLNRELAVLNQRKPQLESARKDREDLLSSLSDIRQERDRRRRALIAEVNRELVKSIDDYNVVIVYERNFPGDFFHFIRERMQGLYLPEELAKRVCTEIDPAALADLVARRDQTALAKISNMGVDWARKFVERFSRLEVFHELQLVSKPAVPVIKVRTRGSPSREIPVNQLSDGQRHTILLTIAMIAESEIPLLIDQPEDDLDNAFIFSSIVRTLRNAKGKRQVLIVTHNANIAVLGDAELIFPMRRSGERGEVFDVGSIDRLETKSTVQGILEGGSLAFLKRKEIYGH